VRREKGESIESNKKDKEKNESNCECSSMLEPSQRTESEWRELAPLQKVSVKG
jgi:hypothetical protein